MLAEKMAEYFLIWKIWYCAPHIKNDTSKYSKNHLCQIKKPSRADCLKKVRNKQSHPPYQSQEPHPSYFSRMMDRNDNLRLIPSSSLLTQFCAGQATCSGPFVFCPWKWNDRISTYELHVAVTQLSDCILDKFFSEWKDWVAEFQIFLILIH